MEAESHVMDACLFREREKGDEKTQDHTLEKLYLNLIPTWFENTKQVERHSRRKKIDCNGLSPVIFEGLSLEHE